MEACEGVRLARVEADECNEVELSQELLSIVQRIKDATVRAVTGSAEDES